MTWTTACLGSGILCLACTVGYIYTTLQNPVAGSVFSGSLIPDILISVVLLVLSCVLLDIARLQPSRHHTFRSLLSQYIFVRESPFCVYFIKRRLGLSSGNVKQYQETLLLDIIRHNEVSKYGKNHNFNEIRCVEDFRSTIPFTDYEDYKDYVTDILNGHDNVLFKGKVDQLTLTSGTTTGKSKSFPKSYKATGQNFRDILTLIRCINISVKGMTHLKFWHNVCITSRKSKTSCGIPKGASSSNPPSILPFYVSPEAVYQVRSEPEALYLHVLFGIRNEDISLLIFWTTPLVLRFLGLIELKWQNLCDDIEEGKLNRSVKIDAKIRLEIEQELCKDIERARHLRSIFTAGFHELIPRIWPSCKLICASSSGTFSSATEILRKKYLGNVQLMSTLHVGSESTYGINLDPEKRSESCFSIIPGVNFYEFIPIKDVDSPTPQSLLAEEVEIGGEYEIVVTTKSGLYRYRTQDLVRVMGFRNHIPYYRFLQRSGDVLSADLDKYPELMFTEAITEASATWTNCSLLNYIATENIHVEKILGEYSRICCYYVFIELMEDGSKLTDEDKSKIDEFLKDKLESYRDFRENRRSLAQSVIIQIETGSIHHVRDMLLQSNPDAVMSQYKFPRLIRRQDVLQYLLAHQV